ncbi:MAG: putative sulfate exporter family transporter [Pirellulales bacterium]|nr:putative sulfate exporter family transporter [Pirellulales bacterium]
MEQRRTFSDDLQAIAVAGTLLALAVAAEVAGFGPTLRGWLQNPKGWSQSPAESLQGVSGGLVVAAAALLAGLCVVTPGRIRFALAFVPVFALAVVAVVLSKQAVVRYYGLEYAVWALLLGGLLSNLCGVPVSWRPAVRTELYLKSGLILLGAEVLLQNLLALGLPGICISWLVTPIVLVTTFWFGQRVLRIESPSLNMVISADMSVCGVSAAIATAAACRAKREELSVAIGLSLAFTAAMMVAMPPVVRLLGLGPVVGGAWIGGTIDSTGAVGVAGAMLGDQALLVATTVKMIQNVLIGIVAFGVATYWVAFVERQGGAKPDAREIWRRMPKFVLGFLAVSAAFTAGSLSSPAGEELVAGATGATAVLRGWFFALAFVSIGLETNVSVLRRQLAGGKALALYVSGQGLNLALTLTVAYAAFTWWFPNAAQTLDK